MNWKRIIIYIVLLFIGTFVSSFFFGFVAGYLHRAGKDIPNWLGIAQILTSLGVMVIVFALLAHAQREHTLLHALLVVLYAWLLSFPFNIILLAQPLAQWILQLVVLLVMAGVGVGIGISYRIQKARVGANAPPLS